MNVHPRRWSLVFVSDMKRDGQCWAPKVCPVLCWDASCAPSLTDAYSAYYPSFLQETQVTSPNRCSLQEEIRPLVYRPLIQLIAKKPVVLGRLSDQFGYSGNLKLYHSSCFSFPSFSFFFLHTHPCCLFGRYTQCQGTVYHI